MPYSSVACLCLDSMLGVSGTWRQRRRKTPSRANTILQVQLRRSMGGARDMIVVGWKGGSPNNVTGGGYGMRIKRRDRDHHFRKGWSSVAIDLDSGGVVDIGLSKSFWGECIELRSASVGKWMLDHGLAPWPKGRPPRFILEPIGNRRFRLSRLSPFPQ